jgi:ABC-type Mn2+/Zn2+ transport system ATPase subunit
LLDDLFSGLDVDEQEEICRLLERLHSGSTTILCASRDPLPPRARRHRVVQLVDGSVRES